LANDKEFEFLNHTRLAKEETRMANKGLTLDEVRKRAAQNGLPPLAQDNMQQLLPATNAARARREALPLGQLAPSDEPAHVFRLAGGQR
jgi:hypothetical protein